MTQKTDIAKKATPKRMTSLRRKFLHNIYLMIGYHLWLDDKQLNAANDLTDVLVAQMMKRRGACSKKSRSE